MNRARFTDSEAGFTLPELMVAIVILGLIIAPITSAIIVGLLTTDSAHTRLSETQNTALSSAFWAGDVQSADSVTKGGSSACDGGTSVVTFRWADDLSANNAASYVVDTVGGVRTLTRKFCRGGALVNKGTIAPDLSISAAPTVDCVPVSCTKPTRVTITMATPSGFTFSINGTRRSTQ